MDYFKKNFSERSGFFPFFSYSKSNSEMRADFYREILSEIPIKYQRIKFLIVNNKKFEDEKNGITDLRINSSSQALESYKKGISNPYFIDSIDINSEITPTETECYVGVFSGWREFENSVTVEKIESFEKLAGKKVTFVPFSNFYRHNEVMEPIYNRITKLFPDKPLMILEWRVREW